MSNDIDIMIELQEYWGIVLSTNVDIARKKKSIKMWQDELAELKGKIASLQNSIKNFKNDIKSNELQLSEIEEKISKLQQRKTSIHNERELKAVNTELESTEEQQSNSEDILINLMDSLSDDEKSLETYESELVDKEKQVDSDITKLNNDITSFKKIISENNEKFDTKKENLSPAHRSKFLKLLKSKEGRAIAEINGEICGFCNFQIPAFLAIEASKSGNPSVCSNCGRYIYKKS